MATTGIPPARIAFYRDHVHATPLSAELYEWEDVVEFFSEHAITECQPCPGHTCAMKHGEAISPGAPRPGTSRCEENVDSVSLLIYDFDHLLRAELEGLCDRIAGLECILYSTHSHLHGGVDDNCVRIVFPLSRAIPAAQFRFFHQRVIDRYGLVWQRNGVRAGADPARKDLSGLYFLPTAPIGNETEFGYERGALLDIDELLSGVPVARPKLVSSPSAPRTGAPQSAMSVDMDALRGLLEKYQPQEDEGEVISKKKLVRRVFRGEPLTTSKEEGQRERSCHRIGKILAHLLPAATPEEAVMELVRQSVSTMPVLPGDGADDALDARFAKVALSWNKGLADRVEKDAAFEAERAAERVRNRKLRERLNLGKRRLEASATSSTPTPTPVAASGGLTDADCEGWEAMLVNKTNQDGTQSLDQVDCNAETILIYHPEWRNVLRYNELTKDVELRGGPLVEYEKAEQVTTGVKYWLQRECGLKLRTGDVMDAILHVAKSNAYDPVRDYLIDVARKAWDGVKRIAMFLEDYCGAATIDAMGNLVGDHIRRISKRWFVSAVARGLSPGCKMDTVLILEGEQGLKKSTAFRALAEPWFTDSGINITEKDSKMLAGRNWFIELSELSAMRATESEAQKSFFSSPTDQFRPPYGRTIATFPRHSLFVGTTNDERYLNDLTGNRRYWPVHCLKIDLQRIRADRDQLWGEAVAIYQEGLTCSSCLKMPEHEDRCVEHRWWLSRDENKALEATNRHRLKNEYADAVRSYILKLPSEMRAGAYTMHEIATEMLGIPGDRVAAVQGPVGRALKTLGFEKKRERDGDALYWKHIVPASLLHAEQRLRLVPEEDVKIKAKRAAASKKAEASP